ncbi:MAG: hypothetical protein JO311_04365, partial [Candidatus Eremiobacteraeota bacterium]|nr:hypothetical protein [Candidatus Eremiobacteraeota bacterium]
MKRWRRRWLWCTLAFCLFILGIGLWQWQSVARGAIGVIANAMIGVRVTYAGMSLGSDGATFRDVLVTS